MLKTEKSAQFNLRASTPLRHLRTSNTILNWILKWTGSQYKEVNMGAMRPCCFFPVKRQAAAL